MKGIVTLLIGACLLLLVGVRTTGFAHPDPAHPFHTHAPAVYDSDQDGTTDDSDCAPSDPAVHRGAADLRGDGRDSNCDGVDGVDADGDGFPVELDCNDGAKQIYPWAPEIAGNGIDEDCDGLDGF
jgi:hypothetical protein